MLLHNILYCVYFFKIQNLFEIPLKNWKKKKKNVFHFIIGFQPIGPAASCFPPPPLGPLGLPEPRISAARFPSRLG
jgi:hypothetical protein